VVLFSTLFASLAAWTRQYTDILGQFGIINFQDTNQRRRVNALLSWILPALWVILFLAVKLPLMMVLIGGIVGSLILLFVVFAVLVFRYKETPHAFIPSLGYDLLFWISCLSIFAIAVYGIIQIF
jgi:Mn2+/Fe2+ NRAMP family transporter